MAVEVQYGTISRRSTSLRDRKELYMQEFRGDQNRQVELTQSIGYNAVTGGKDRINKFSNLPL